jgi:hypothetical protein
MMLPGSIDSLAILKLNMTNDMIYNAKSKEEKVTRDKTRVTNKKGKITKAKDHLPIKFYKCEATSFTETPKNKIFYIS